MGRVGWSGVDDGLRAATRREAKTKCVSTGYLRLSPAPRSVASIFHGVKQPATRPPPSLPPLVILKQGARSAGR